MDCARRHRQGRQVIPIIRDLDKQAIGWNEFADAGLSEGDIDHYYNWNPLTVVRPPSADMPLVEESDIISMEGPMWSETIRRGTQNEFMMFPRAMSHAEIGWTPQAQRDYDSFAKRMEPMGARLLAKGSNFYDTPKVQWDTDAAGTDAKSAPGQQMLVEPAVVVAPGTIVSEDGRSIAVDNVNDEDGTSNSELTAPLSATVDFGDGSEPVPATFAPVQEPTNLELTDTARYVKIVITENHADDNQFATIGELEFRATSDEEPVEVDPVVQVWAPPATCGPDTTVPEINAIADQAVQVGSAVSLQVEATDDRSSDLTYSATGLPAGVTIDPATGQPDSKEWPGSGVRKCFSGTGPHPGP